MARCAKKSTEPQAETKKEKTGKKVTGEETVVAVNETVEIEEVKEKKPVKKAAKIKEEAKPEKEKKTGKTTKAKAVPLEEEPKPVGTVVEDTPQEPISVAHSKSDEENMIELMSPTRKMKKLKGYSKKDLEEFKVVILQKREEIIEQIQILKDQMMDPSTGQYVNENSPYSLHMAEQGTDAQEREKLYLWAQRENKFLGYLEDSLVRIENGTYGICIECIDEPQNLCPTCPLIPKERLMAVPHTQHCLQVKTKMQKTKK